MKFTGERLLPSITNESMFEHLHRYVLAKRFCANKIVLDIACGEGYGSNIISDVAEYVYAVEIDKNVVKSAKEKYVKKNLEFKCSSIENIPLKDNSVDVILSFETIEHIPDYIKALNELKRVLKNDGLLVISTPNKTNYTDKTGNINPYHIHEFTRSEFIELLSGFYKYREFLSQSFIYGSYIWNDQIKSDIQFYNGNYNEIKQTLSEEIEMYCIALCSDQPVNNPAVNSVFIANDLINEIHKVFKSKPYKIGNAILYPLIVLKRLFQKKK